MWAPCKHPGALPPPILFPVPPPNLHACKSLHEHMPLQWQRRPVQDSIRLAARDLPTVSPVRAGVRGRAAAGRRRANDGGPAQVSLSIRGLFYRALLVPWDEPACCCIRTDVCDAAAAGRLRSEPCATCQFSPGLDTLAPRVHTVTMQGAKSRLFTVGH